MASRPTPARRRVRAAVVGLVAVAMTVTACGAHTSASRAASSDSTSPSSSSTTPSPAPADLARFYDQHLDWRSCGGGFQCSTLTVPVDYSNPTGATLGVAVIRKLATGHATESLIVNPGGPGGSGVTFVRQAASAFGGLTTHLNLVSFDPRGVGESHPIRCLSSAQLDRYIDTDPDPTTPAELATVVAQSKKFAAACYARNRSFLSHVGTIDQARDMDVLRAALGDAKITYYGASYGTYLGALYASLFPTHIRAMVLDGALNPAESATAQNGVQATGFQRDLGDFVAACVRDGSCPLGRTPAAALAAIRALGTRLATHPESSGGRTFGAGEFFEGLAAGLYNPSDWPDLQIALTRAEAGNGSVMLEFADSLTERSANGTYTNLVESNMAINCIDRPWPRTVSTYQAAAAQFEKQSPDFGAAIEYGSLPCAFWKVSAVGTPGPVSAPGAPPIVVIGTTRDPATPYVWAQALAHQLSSGVLLTYEGDGHTAYLRGDSCVDSAVNSYLLDLHVPKSGIRCS